jgi:hypothetical protein
MPRDGWVRESCATKQTKPRGWKRDVQASNSNGRGVIAKRRSNSRDGSGDGGGSGIDNDATGRCDAKGDAFPQVCDTEKICERHSDGEG